MCLILVHSQHVVSYPGENHQGLGEMTNSLILGNRTGIQLELRMYNKSRRLGASLRDVYFFQDNRRKSGSIDTMLGITAQ
jgi:hypothetical protein